MANGVFNIARGRAGYYFADGLGLAGANSRLVLVALEVVEADDVLNNYVDLGAILGAAGNTEATSTNYARIGLAAADVSITIDNTANTMQVEVASSQQWASIS